MIPLLVSLFLLNIVLSAYTIWVTRTSARQLPWHWLVPLLVLQWVGAWAAAPWIYMAWAGDMAIWYWVISSNDPDEPFRRLKKKLQSSMTKIQQMVLHRQQVEAFR